MATPPHSPTQPPVFVFSDGSGIIAVTDDRDREVANPQPTRDEMSEMLVWAQVDAEFVRAMKTLPWLLRPSEVEDGCLANLGEAKEECGVVYCKTTDRRLTEHITTRALDLIGDSLTHVVDECERAIHTLSKVALKAKRTCNSRATSPMHPALDSLYEEVLTPALDSLYEEVLTLLHIVCFVAGSYMNAELTELRVNDAREGFHPDVLASAHALYLECVRRTTFSIDIIDEQGQTVEVFDKCGTVCHIHHHMVAIDVKKRLEGLGEVFDLIDSSQVESPVFNDLRSKLAMTIARFPWMASLQDKGCDLTLADCFACATRIQDSTLADCFACATRIQDSVGYADPMRIGMVYVIDECDIASTVFETFIDFVEEKLAEEGRIPVSKEMRLFFAGFFARVEQAVRSIHLVVAQCIYADMRALQIKDEQKRIPSSVLSSREAYYRACIDRTTPRTFAFRDVSNPWKETQILKEIAKSTSTSLQNLRALAAKRAR